MPSSCRNDLSRASAESRAHILARAASVEDTNDHIRDSRKAIQKSLRLLDEVSRPDIRD